MNAPLNIEFFVGIHNDPRLGRATVLYGLGSYVTTPLPVTLDYLYFVVTNADAFPAMLRDVWLEAADGTVLRHLDIPGGSLDGRMLPGGAAFALGFLRDLLTRRLRDDFQVPDPFTFRIVCRIEGAEPVYSAAYMLNLDYPINPLQDTSLSPYGTFFSRRMALFAKETERIRTGFGSLREYADLHLRLGMHTVMREDGVPCRCFREWMPAAARLWLTTDRVDFQCVEPYAFHRLEEGLGTAGDASVPFGCGGELHGVWQLMVPVEELPHGTYVELRVAASPDSAPERRVPAFALWVEQDARIKEQWCARVWDPPSPHKFVHDSVPRNLEFPRVYEAHVGIAQAYVGRTDESVGTYAAFTRKVLPRIHEAGYTVVQLMGILEHPLYKSFGYQVSSYFAPSSRFGTAEDFKELVDTAHSLGMAVVLDIPHSHACPNTEQGIARYDTSAYLFADKPNQWGTCSFDYAREMTRRFLLSNCRYWMDAFHVDGFRFDAVGNMVYVDHGFGDDFSQVARCFYTANGSQRIDEAGVLYLALANALVHELNPNSLTVAEEFSGMPGMTSQPEQGGLGFDYRFAMGIPDFWGKFIKEGRTLGALWHEMTNRRGYERTISYVACHDQCINGKDAMIWRLIGDAMHSDMSVFVDSWNVSRGVDLYKLMRLVTLTTAGHGMLNFMGDEFGHPEWIDGELYAHRQWQLTEDHDLKYAQLGTFDSTLLHKVMQAHLPAFARTARLRYLHEADRLLAFERGNLLVVMNFHETRPQLAVELHVTPGKYVEVLSTDEQIYAGHGNLTVGSSPLEHFTTPGGPGDDAAGTALLTLYVPPLVALVLARHD